MSAPTADKETRGADVPRLFLEALFKDVPRELHLLLWAAHGKRSHWFHSDQLEQIGLLAIQLSANSDLYIETGISTINYGEYQRCRQDEVAGIVGLWADVDFHNEWRDKKKNEKRKAKVYPPTVDDARNIILAMGLPPTAIVHSGHGLQPWWLFKEPWLFADSAHEGIERAKAMQLIFGWQKKLQQKAKAKGWDQDSTHDLARLMRIPGTWNRKPEYPEPVPTTLLEAKWDVRFDPQDFEEFLLQEEVEHDTKAAKVQVGNIIIDENASAPAGKFDALYANDDTFANSWDRKRPFLPDQSPSGYDQAIANRMALADWTDHEMVDAFIGCRRKHGDEIKRHQAYYSSTIGKARAFAAKFASKGKRAKAAAARAKSKSESEPNGDGTGIKAEKTGSEMTSTEAATETARKTDAHNTNTSTQANANAETDANTADTEAQAATESNDETNSSAKTKSSRKALAKALTIYAKEDDRAHKTHIVRIIKHGEENASYELILSDGRKVVIKDTAALYSQAKITNAFRDAGYFIDPVAQSDWKKLNLHLWQLIETEKTLTTKESTQSWIRGFMKQSYPIESGQVNMASANDKFEVLSKLKGKDDAGGDSDYWGFKDKQGYIYLLLKALHHHVNIRCGTRISEEELSKRLSQIGFKDCRPSGTKAGETAKVRMWIGHESLIEEES